MNTGRGISGAASSLMNAASLAAGREIHGVVSDVLWFTVGFAIGGTPGGAVGGGYGALATRAGVFVLGELPSYCFKWERHRRVEVKVG